MWDPYYYHYMSARPLPYEPLTHPPLITDGRWKTSGHHFVIPARLRVGRRVWGRRLPQRVWAEPRIFNPHDATYAGNVTEVGLRP